MSFNRLILKGLWSIHWKLVRQICCSRCTQILSNPLEIEGHIRCDKFAAAGATKLLQLPDKDGYGRRKASIESGLEVTPIQAVFFHQPLQRTACLACMVCGVGDVSRMGGKEMAQIGPLKLLNGLGFRLTEGDGLRQRVLIRGGEVHILQLEDGGRGQNDSLLDDGFQLPDVPRPGVCHELVQSVWRETTRRAAIVMPIATQKVSS
jgi:hypothetical protein